MKSLILGSLLVVGATQVGCTTSSAAVLNASWSFETLSTKTMTGCPAGYDTAVIVSNELDANLNFVGPPFLDLYNCNALDGTTAPLPPSWFDVWVEIRQGSEQGPEYAQSGDLFFDITTVNVSKPTPPIVNDGGYFHLKWKLVTASTGAGITCGTAGATRGVEAISTQVGNPSNAASDIFNCDEGVTVDIGEGESVTDPLLAGNYTVSVDALNGAMQSVGTAAAINGTVVMPPTTTAITDLGLVMIPITGT